MDRIEDSKGNKGCKSYYSFSPSLNAKPISQLNFDDIYETGLVGVVRFSYV